MLKIVRNLGRRREAVSDTLTLSFEDRSKGRLKTTTDSGAEAGLFLERGQILHEGDVLQTECGKLVGVRNAPEEVVTASAEDWGVFARACYHLGNRHVALEIGEKRLRFQPDHVLEELARLLGLQTRAEVAPFTPEQGAYAGMGHSHHH
jgi:urease accessory protein